MNWKTNQQFSVHHFSTKNLGADSKSQLWLRWNKMGIVLEIHSWMKCSLSVGGYLPMPFPWLVRWTLNIYRFEELWSFWLPTLNKWWASLQLDQQQAKQSSQARAALPTCCHTKAGWAQGVTTLQLFRINVCFQIFFHCNEFCTTLRMFYSKSLSWHPGQTHSWLHHQGQNQPLK